MSRNRRGYASEYIACAVRSLLLAVQDEAPEFHRPFDRLIEGQQRGDAHLIREAGRELEAALENHQGELPHSVEILLAVVKVEAAEPEPAGVFDDD